jgi:hypothetical protein
MLERIKKFGQLDGREDHRGGGQVKQSEKKL